MIAIPESVRDEVVTQVYADCDRLRWESLTHQQKTRQYEAWVNAPDVGGKLGRYMKGDRVRLWLKDGPAKEYVRALNGQGRFQQFTKRRLPTPSSVVRKALGDDWAVDADSITDKPLRCTAKHEGGADARRVIWGQAENLKDLIWAAILEKANTSGHDPLVVIMRPPGKPVPPATKSHVESVAKAAGVDTVFAVEPSRAPACNTEA